MKKCISVLLILVLVLNVATVLAESNVKAIEEEHYWELGSISENEVHEEYFPFEVTKMEVPEGMEYVGYDAETGYHSFKALKDLTDVEGYMYYKETVKEDLNEEEEGESNSIGKPGEGVGGKIEWGAFDLGKHDWDPDEYTKNYAIRIDMRKYQDEEYIIVQDKASDNLSLSSEITVSMLHPDEYNVVENLGAIDFETLEHEGQGFTIKIPVIKDILAYDIVYFMDHDGQPVSNTYKVFTVKEYSDIESGGNVTGQDKPTPEPEEPEEEPDTPDIPEETPEEPEETPVVPEETPDETPETPEGPIIEEEPEDDDEDYYTPIERPGDPEEKEEDEAETEEIEIEEENEETEDEEEIIEDKVEDEIEIDTEETEEDKEVVVIESDDTDKEVKELLPKTGISEVVNVITGLGAIIVLLGAISLIKK